MKKIISVVSTILATVSSAFAQMPSTLYFMDQNPLIHNFNPSFQPTDKMYIGMPGLSLVSVNAGNSKLAFEDIYVPRTIDGKNTTVLFLHPEATNELRNVMNKISPRDRIFADYNVQLLNFGMRIKEKSYVSFSFSNRMEMNTILPREMFKAALMSEENGSDTEYSFGLGKFSSTMNCYSELAFGYSYAFSDKFQMGGKIKYLIPHAGYRTDFKDMDLYISKDEWRFTGDGEIDASMPGLEIYQDEEGKIDSVALPKQIFQLIQRYLQARKQRGNVATKSPLFVATSRRCKDARLQTQSISRLAKSSLRKAGYDSERLTCHSCRRSFANIALEGGIAIRDIQKTLRHKAISTTEIYLHDIDTFSNLATCNVADTILGGLI